MDRDDAMLDYLQGRLTPEERASFEAEIARDSSLSAEVSLMKSVRAALKEGPEHENAAAVWNRLSADMDASPQAANENRRPWLEALKYAAACVLAVAVWQFAVVPRLGALDGGFRAASEQSNAFMLQVKFVESATLSEIGNVLGPLGGVISDGPSALGILRLSFPDARRRDEALDALDGRDDLVDFVSVQ